MKQLSGRKVAYVTMLSMLALSIAGNVAHTLYLDPSASPRKLVGAVMWPVMVWLGVELFVRVEWKPLPSHRIIRWGGILIVSTVAAIVSYSHMRALLKMDGEEWVVYTLGPAGVDGLMLMATLALLLTRPGVQVPAEDPAEDTEPVLNLGHFHPDPAPVSAPPAEDLPVPVSPAAPRTPRVPRVTWDPVTVSHMVLEGSLKDHEIAAKVQAIGPKQVQRVRRAATLLRQDPRAEVPAAWKVPAAVIPVIRNEVLAR